MVGLGQRATRLLVALIVIAVFGASAGGAAASGGSGPRAVGPSLGSAYCPDTQEKEFLTRINNYRASKGLAPLKLSAKLGAAADYHSADMATNNYFSHTLFNGTTWSQNIKNFGYTYNTYRAENIAAGYQSASAVYSAWKASPGHRANMLDPNLKAIGIGRGYNVNSTYDWYWTTTFGGTVDAAPSC